MLVLNSGDVIASKYLLERPLAKGGMGAVWVARHVELDMRVALKVMAPEHAHTAFARDRFEREAKACAQMKSPHVVAVHDYGVTDGSPFLVMELLEGEELQAKRAREKRLSLSSTISVLLPLCKALRRAHELGIVHRDIKPSNVFLARQGGDTIVKLLDFGVARVTNGFSGETTRTGALLGSPCYMSPEQARGRRVDHRSDLWSLAVVFYECITGRLPFASHSLGDLLIEVCTAPIPPPTRIAPDLPAAVDSFFERALARDPDARFQSADAFAEALVPLTPTAPGIERPIAASRPKTENVALVVGAALVLGLGALAAHRVASRAPDAFPVVPRAKASLAMPFVTPAESAIPAEPSLAPPEAAAPEPSVPTPETSTGAPLTSPPSRARRTPKRRPSPRPPPPTRDPTFGF